MTTTHLIFLPPILILVFLAQNSSSTSQANCSYTIEIQTTCTPNVKTTSPIGIRFSDKDGNLVILKHLKKQGSVCGSFRRWAMDGFDARGPCMSRRVCSLYLKRVGSDEWRPGWVKVIQQLESGGVQVSYMFYFRVFVPQNVWYGFDYCHSYAGFIPHVASFHKN